MNEPSISLSGVTCRFGKTVALDALSLVIDRGSLFGLVGPDGAGKTTAIRAIVGLGRVDEGTVIIHGTKRDDIRNVIGYMPQQYSLYGDLSAAENMMFFGRLFGLSKTERRERTDELLALVGLSRFHARRAAALSGGMYKKLAVACALIHQPEILVLDEPTNGVDPVSRRELWGLLYDLVDEGVTIVVSTPDMNEAARCHRIALLNHGNVLALGKPANLVSQLRHAVLAVECDDRTEIETALLARDDVFDCAPEGASLRVLARYDGTSVRDFLDGLPNVSSVVKTHASFEDVFLALINDQDSVAA